MSGYKDKSSELKVEATANEEAIRDLGATDASRGEAALELFDWTQKAAEIWRGSNNTVKREILDEICLNRHLNDVNLVTQKRKPFDVFAERPILRKSRGNKTPIELFRPPISEIKGDGPFLRTRGLRLGILSSLRNTRCIAGAAA